MFLYVFSSTWRYEFLVFTDHLVLLFEACVGVPKTIFEMHANRTRKNVGEKGNIQHKEKWWAQGGSRFQAVWLGSCLKKKRKSMS